MQIRPFVGVATLVSVSAGLVGCGGGAPPKPRESVAASAPIAPPATLPATPPAIVKNDAAFVRQSAPKAVAAGAKHTVSVTMRNTSNVTWTHEAGYKLGSQPQDTQVWGLQRVVLPKPVAPGEEATFDFTITAPLRPGTYRFGWRMVQDTVAWFGSPSAVVSVRVKRK